jgi:monoamine oxidase
MLDAAEATDVVVLGAGVSGLAAAARLTQAGCTVRVLEVRDRAGGRILTVRGGKWPVPIDLGAEFIQGRIPALLTLARQIGLPVVELNGSRWQAQDGRVARAEDVSPRVDEIMSRLPAAGPDDDQSFDQFLARCCADASLADARARARRRIESYDAAHPDRVSIRFLVREREAEAQIDGDRVFRLATGYDGIPATLLARIPPDRGRVHLETIVTDVKWAPGAVTVHARGPDGAALGPFSARRVVVALPVGVLQALPTEPGAVRFTPPLDQKQAALQGIEMGKVVKLVLAFKERVWETAIADDLGFLQTPDEPFSGWWTGYPVYAPLLVAWVGGPAADALAGLSTTERVDRALDSLAGIVREPRAAIDRQIVACATHDWAADPFARGAYSYTRVGGIERQAALASPVDDTLFFAGEATELRGYQATVHGALFAGERAADEVLRSLGQS